MRSDVVFDSPYLDRYLRFGWYLDIIMLFLLGDASLMFGPDSVVGLDYRDHTFDDGWFEVICFFLNYHTSGVILGHIPFWMRFTDLHRVARLSPLTRYMPRRGPIRYFIMILQWSLPWATQSGPHFLHSDVIMFSFQRLLFDAWTWFNCGFGLSGSHIWW